jgi:hypothetical protein
MLIAWALVGIPYGPESCMDYYEIWCDLVDTRRDVELARNVEAYLGALRDAGKIAGYRMARCKFGFNQPGLGEFHITVMAETLAQLDEAFREVSPREGEIQALHAKVYSMVTNFKSALYRDFPDASRRVERPGGEGTGVPNREDGDWGPRPIPLNRDRGLQA